MANVTFLPPAVDAVARIARTDRRAMERLRSKIDAFAAGPAGDYPWVQALVGTEGLRIRQGDYRAVIVVRDGPPVVVTVTKVAHRKDVYR